MVLTARKRQHVLLIALGLLFSFLVGSLIAQGGLPALNPLPELFRFRWAPSGPSAPPVALPPFLLQAAIYAILIAGFGALLYAIITKQKWLSQDIVGSLLGFLIMLALLWLFAGLGSGIRQAPDEGDQDGVPPDGTPPLEGVAGPSSALLGALFWLVIFGAFVYFFARHRVRLRAVARPAVSQASQEAREQAQAAIERTLEELAAAGDPRQAIFRCYVELREILAAHGLREAQSATPREFELAAEMLLVLPAGELSALVALFEEARYSQHAMGEAEAARARSHLEAVREALTGASEGAALRAREATRVEEVRQWLANR